MRSIFHFAAKSSTAELVASIILRSLAEARSPAASPGIARNANFRACSNRSNPLAAWSALTCSRRASGRLGPQVLIRLEPVEELEALLTQAMSEKRRLRPLEGPELSDRALGVDPSICVEPDALAPGACRQEALLPGHSTCLRIVPSVVVGLVGEEVHRLPFSLGQSDR